MKTSRKVITVIVLAVGIALIVMAADFLHKLASYTPLFLSGGPSEWQIESYGREKFVRQALEFQTAKKANAEFLQRFDVKRIEDYSPGVLLVCGENRKYIKGLYIDPEGYFEDTYGSGVSITFRSSHIGVAELKRRIPVGFDLRALGTAQEMYANDWNDYNSKAEPNGL
ncbi:MAG: hypothetical protein IH624_14485 [Phycisphaerae bacterium]|nr:hypothetical protein [Phycisphaerae bacterium]